MSDNKNTDAGEQRTFEDKVQVAQDRIEASFRRIGRGSWARILRMARKPSKQEFKQTCIVCGLGLFILGFIGFVILVVMDNMIPGFFSWLGIGY